MNKQGLNTDKSNLMCGHMAVKAHYENHLAPVYSWMAGNFETLTGTFLEFLKHYDITPLSSGVAIDLGCGHGVQSIALAKQGFKVIAIDFNRMLLSELEPNAGLLPIVTHCDDILNIAKYAPENTELVVCCGDTLTHLDSNNELEQLVCAIAGCVCHGGKVVFSFRDYSTQPEGSVQCIPVKSDENRIFTCCMHYGLRAVQVTDLLYQNHEGEWQLDYSTYSKLRVSAESVIHLLIASGFSVLLSSVIQGMITIIARRAA